MKIEINNLTKYYVPKKIIVDKAIEFLQIKGIDKAELTIHFVTSAKIRELNQKFRKINRTTDVLSFPLIKNVKDIENQKEPEEKSIGDIFICYDQIKQQAKKYSKTIKQELLFLTEHALKHLIGIHHK